MADKIVKQVTKAIENTKKALEGFIGSAKKELDKKKSPPSSSTSTKTTKMSPAAMKFPYTFTAKLGQFPWAFYIRNNWIYRYYFIALFVSAPVFQKITNVVNSEGNAKKWADILAKDEEELAHHHH